MPRDMKKKFFVDSRRKIIENAEKILDEALILYEKEHYQRAAFNAMTCIEECGKLWMIRMSNANFDSTCDLPSLGKLLRDHTQKTKNFAMGFYINSAADRRQGSHPISKVYRTSGIILLVRSEEWMNWRNSCLYMDISVSQQRCESPLERIGKEEACYFIRMAYEGLIENAFSGYQTESELFGITSKDMKTMSDKEISDMTKEFATLNEKASDLFNTKLKDLEEFMTKNHDVNLDKIDFLVNPERYRNLAEQIEAK